MVGGRPVGLSVPVPNWFQFDPKEFEIGSGSAGSVLTAGSAGSGSKKVRFPVPSLVRGLPAILELPDVRIVPGNSNSVVGNSSVEGPPSPRAPS